MRSKRAIEYIEARKKKEKEEKEREQRKKKKITENFILYQKRLILLYMYSQTFTTKVPSNLPRYHFSLSTIHFSLFEFA